VGKKKEGELKAEGRAFEQNSSARGNDGDGVYYLALKIVGKKKKVD
jgi:hypothetical protein